MKPKPLNHFTVPLAMMTYLLLSDLRSSRRSCHKKDRKAEYFAVLNNKILLYASLLD